MSAATTAAPRPRVSPFSRIYGFGSVYAKTLRDSRLTFIIMAGLTGGLILAVGAAIGKDIASPTGRQDLVHLVNAMPPIVAGLAGNPINVGTLGGYLSWKYGPFFALIIGIWLILSLSSTLARETQRGSMDILATTPLGKRRVAIEKLAAHLTVLGVVLAILAACTWLTGQAFATLPEDAIPADAAIDFALSVGLLGLASGAVAFALGPALGRGAAGGIAGLLMVAGFFLSGYQAAFPAFQPLANLTWFGWQYGNLPLAGRIDWISLLPVAAAAAVVLVIGVELFARRDLGVFSRVPFPRLPAAPLGTGGPGRVSFGERLPVALGWGIGIGVLGLMMSAAAGSLADVLATASPDTRDFFKAVFPDYDLTSAGSALQLIFIGFGFILAGFAAATLVAGWGSDESSGRLEQILTTPISRARWAILGGVGVYGAILVMTAVAAIGIAIGAATVGGNVATPVVGTLVLGFYALALAGIGLAVGGLFRSSFAGEIVAIIVIATFLLDIIIPALGLPDWVHDLALTAHLGRPMVGVWDVPGIGVCLALAVGGVVLAGWGMARRDVAR